MEMFRAEHRSNGPLSSYPHFRKPLPTPKRAPAFHHLASVANTRQNILKSRKSCKRMNESEAKTANYHQGLSKPEFSNNSPKNVLELLIVLGTLVSHLCEAQGVWFSVPTQLLPFL